MKKELFEALDALCDMWNQYCGGPGGHNFMSVKVFHNWRKEFIKTIKQLDMENCPDYFKTNDGKIFQCIGTDEGYFWAENPDNSFELLKFDQCDCETLSEEELKQQEYFNSLYGDIADNLRKGEAKAEPSCSGDCGMNYCDEYGCIDARQSLDGPLEPVSDTTTEADSSNEADKIK